MKRVISLMLCIILTIGLFPLSVFADTEEISYRETKTILPGNEYIIVGTGLNKYYALGSDGEPYDITAKKQGSEIKVSSLDSEMVVWKVKYSEGSRLSGGDFILSNGDILLSRTNDNKVTVTSNKLYSSLSGHSFASGSIYNKSKDSTFYLWYNALEISFEYTESQTVSALSFYEKVEPVESDEIIDNTEITNTDLTDFSYDSPSDINSEIHPNTENVNSNTDITSPSDIETESKTNIKEPEQINYKAEITSKINGSSINVDTHPGETVNIKFTNGSEKTKDYTVTISDSPFVSLESGDGFTLDGSASTIVTVKCLKSGNYDMVIATEESPVFFATVTLCVSVNKGQNETEEEKTTYVQTDSVRAGNKYIIVAKSDFDGRYYALSSDGAKTDVTEYIISNMIMIPESFENGMSWLSRAANGNRLGGGSITLSGNGMYLGSDEKNGPVILGNEDIDTFGLTFTDGRLKNKENGYLGFGDRYENKVFSFGFYSSFEGTLSYYERYMVESIEKKENHFTAFAIGDIPFGSTPNPNATALYGTPSYSFCDTKDGIFTEWNTENDTGIYYVKASVPGNESYDAISMTVSFKVTKADQNVIVPSPHDLTENGKNQPLITPGYSDYGTMKYRLDSETKYSSSVPLGTVAGEYIIWYYSEGDKNHYDSPENFITVTVKESEGNLSFSKTDKILPGKEYIIVYENNDKLYALFGSNNIGFDLSAFKVSKNAVSVPYTYIDDISFMASVADGDRAYGGSTVLINSEMYLGRSAVNNDPILGKANTAYFGLDFTNGKLSNRSYYLGYTEKGFTFSEDKKAANISIYERNDGLLVKENNSITSFTCPDIVYGETPDPVAYSEHGTVTYTYSKVKYGIYGAWSNLNEAGTWYVKAKTEETKGYKKAEKILSFTVSKADIDVTKAYVYPKEYDGTTDAKAKVLDTSGIVNGSDVTVKVRSAKFFKPGAGENKYVLITYSLSGKDAENYNTPNDSMVFGTISPKELKVEGTKVYNKPYDGNTSAFTLMGKLSGVISGDNVYAFISNAQFESKDSENGKNVTVNYSLFGWDSFNYTISSDTLSADITPITVTVKVNDINMFAGGSVPRLSYSISGFIEGESFIKYPSLKTNSDGKTAGTFPISVYGYSVSKNYKVKVISGNVTVYDAIYEKNLATETNEITEEENPVTDLPI